MDINILKEIGENVLLLANVAQTTVPQIVTAIMTTLFIHRNTQIQERNKLKEAKFAEVADELLEKGQITYFEYYKCKNFLKIA